MHPGQGTNTQTLVTTLLGARCLRSDAEQRVRLFVMSDARADVVTLYEGLPVTIGRGETASLSIPDTSLSREHARFEVREGELWVQDLGSTNGTRVLGKREQVCRLTHGSEVVLGRVNVLVHIDPPRAPELSDIAPAGRFEALLAAEVTRSTLFGHSLALLRLEAENPESTPLEAWYPALSRLLRPVDQAGFWRRSGVQVYLPETNAKAALDLGRRLLEETRLSLRIGIAAAPEHARDLEALTEAATRAQKNASGTAPTLPSEGTPAPRVLETRSRAMRGLLDQALKLGPRDMPVLIRGETGSGKEHLARLVHAASPRKDRAFEAINCGAIPEALVNSALFGHEAGALKEAEKPVKGVFERAHSGTVLLDEVSELSSSAQAALLRVLETGSFARAGSSEPIQVDVRVIATTQKNLEELVATGRFRQDLLFRLNAVTLEVPPLRDRREDILPLAEYFQSECATREHLPERAISDGAKQLLERYAWPGNVRELKNEVERALVLSNGSALEASDFSPHLAAAGETLLTTSLDFLEVRDLKTEVQRYEADLIRATLERCKGNQTEAAKVLRLPRRTLVYKLRALGIAADE